MKYWIVDAFATSPFEGNPAAVCWLDTSYPSAALQKIACEFHLHETVFLSPLQNQHVQVQIFTPTAQESVCGHGLLAAAHVCWAEQLVTQEAASPLYLETPRGIFPVTREGSQITLTTKAKIAEPAAVPERLINALGSPPIAVSRCGQIYVVEMYNPKQVLKLEPDIAKLEKILCRGVVVTAEGGNDVPYDFMSRFFAPGAGFKEDAVTLWNHCFLASYWARRLEKTALEAMQGADRTGALQVECENGQVKITGTCTLSMQGELVPPSPSICCGDLFEGAYREGE